EMDKINLALTQSAATNANPTQHTATAALNGREIELNDLRAECRLFLLHSQDVLAEVERLQERLIQTEIFSKSASLSENLRAAPALMPVLDPVDSSVLSHQWRLAYFTRASILWLGLLVLVSAILGRSISLYGARQLAHLKKSPRVYALLAAFLR